MYLILIYLNEAAATIINSGLLWTENCGAIRPCEAIYYDDGQANLINDI